MRTLALIALLVAAPEADSAPVEGPEAAAPADPDAGPDAEPGAAGETLEPPPPTLEGDKPEVPPTPEGAEELLEGPKGTTPPGEEPGRAETGPAIVEDEPDPAELEAAIEAAENLPYAATGARKSAVRRNNDVMVRPFRQPVYSIAASARLGALLSGGQRIVTPVGWGAAAQLRIHFVGVLKSRFGVELHAGHTRFQQRRDYESFSGSTLTRTTLLTHTDFSAGPSFQIPIGAVFLQIGASAGVSISTLARPLSADASEDEQISETDPLVRGGLSVGVPILNRHGLSVGAGVQQAFSQREVLVDRSQPDGPSTDPFGTVFEAFLGYSIWF